MKGKNERRGMAARIDKKIKQLDALVYLNRYYTGTIT